MAIPGLIAKVTRHISAIKIWYGRNFCSGELPFRWETDFEYTLFEGCKNNQKTHEGIYLL
jgi:hypothetical protein